MALWVAETVCTGILAVDEVLAEDPLRCALLVIVAERPFGFAKSDFHPSGDFLCLRLLPRRAAA